MTAILSLKYKFFNVLVYYSHSVKLALSKAIFLLMALSNLEIFILFMHSREFFFWRKKDSKINLQHVYMYIEHVCNRKLQFENTKKKRKDYAHGWKLIMNVKILCLYINNFILRSWLNLFLSISHFVDQTAEAQHRFSRTKSANTMMPMLLLLLLLLLMMMMWSSLKIVDITGRNKFLWLKKNVVKVAHKRM